MREVIERTQDFGLEEESGSNVSRIPAYLDSSGQPYVSAITSYSVQDSFTVFGHRQCVMQ